MTRTTTMDTAQRYGCNRLHFLECVLFPIPHDDMAEKDVPSLELVEGLPQFNGRGRTAHAQHDGNAQGIHLIGISESLFYVVAGTHVFLGPGF